MSAPSPLSPFPESIHGQVFNGPTVVHQLKFGGGPVGNSNTTLNVTVPNNYNVIEVNSEQLLWINILGGANSAGPNTSANGVVTSNTSFISPGGLFVVAPNTVVSLYSANAQNASVSYYNGVVGP